MARRHLHVYLVYFLIFLTMFRCVKACSYIGNSVRSLSNHQVRCEAYQEEEAHSAAIRKSIAARNKQKQLQRRSLKKVRFQANYICLKLYVELLVYHFKRCSTPSSYCSFLNPTYCSKSWHARIFRICWLGRNFSSANFISTSNFSSFTIPSSLCHGGRQSTTQSGFWGGRWSPQKGTPAACTIQRQLTWAGSY